MPRLAKMLMAIILITAFAAPAWAQVAVPAMPPPVAPGMAPAWTAVPSSPKVLYAPNLPTDVFRYQGKYYFFWEGYLYKGNKPTGPWKDVKNVPDWFYGIDPAYFKTVKKEGAPTPPPAPAPWEQPAPTPPTFEMPKVEIPPPAPPAPPGTGAPAAPAPQETAPEGAPSKPPKVM